MRTIVLSCLVALLASEAFAQTPDPPLAEKRLPVSTLVREDVFAGWRTNDLERYARAEKNIDLLLDERPAERAELLAWKGATKVYRAVLALEAGKTEESERIYQESLALFDEARKVNPHHLVVVSVIGGSYALFADRLPEQYRSAAWTVSYDNYQKLWKQQAAALDRLPVHMRGELLSGLAQTAERTGHKEQLDEYLDKIIEVLPNTGYERVAKQWKIDPVAAAKSNITCKSCHNEGRLNERLANLTDK